MALDTEDELANIWEDDLLGRHQDAVFLQNFLLGMVSKRKAQGRQGSYVLNVDGHWGAGKSFFVSRLALQLRGAGYVVAEVDAWRDDHTDDPFVSILAAIDASLAQFTTRKSATKTAWEKVTKSAAPIALRMGTGLVKTFIKKKIGEDLSDVLSGLPDSGISAIDETVDGVAGEVVIEIDRLIDGTTERLISHFTERAEAVASFKKRLGSAADLIREKTGGPIFVLVDELDRCRPSYAVALLERVKHLFEAESVVFIFSTDTSQLQHSVQGAYGPGFDGFRYLNRFFERTYLLSAPSPANYITAKWSVIDEAKLESPCKTVDIFSHLVSHLALDLREIEQCIDVIESVIAAWRHKEKIEAVSLMALAIAFKRSAKVSWAGAETIIGSNYVVPIGYRRRGFNSDAEMVTFNIANALRHLQSAGKNVASAHNINTNTEESQYIYNVLSPEWNGRPLPNAPTPSIQMELPILVANAGRLTSVRQQVV